MKQLKKDKKSQQKTQRIKKGTNTHLINLEKTNIIANKNSSVKEH